MCKLHNGVTGHRGDPQHFPQNTIAGFESAIKMNCDWVETDIHLTRDGKVVISHDPFTLLEGDRQCIISQCDLSELRKVNMAARFNMLHDDREPIFAAMPTLEETLELFRSQDKVKLSLQPKAPGVIPIAAKIIRQMKFPTEMLGFNDGNLDYMLLAQNEFPEAEIFYDRSTIDKLDEDIAIAQKFGFRNLVVNEFHLTAGAAARILEANLIPGVWNINNPGEMDRFIAMGVQRFYTDFPAVLIKKLQSRL